MNSTADDPTTGTDVNSTPEPTDEYHSPRAFTVGSARDLVRGYNDGKYSDGYTGYYWER